MKKSISIVITLMLLVNVFAFSAFAAVPSGNAIALTLSAEDKAYAAGETVMVTLSIETTSAVSGLYAGEIEVAYDSSIFEIHDLIDNIEEEIKQRFGCETVIHMDPIDTKDPKTLALKESLNEILKEEFPEISFHDFRVVYGNTHTNLIFDIIKPYTLKTPSKEICSTIKTKMLEKHPHHFCVIRVDHDYSGDQKN